MKREIIKTGDGSATIYLPEWNEHYHSKHGALQEAQHVFIESGYRHYVEKKSPKRLNILEIGFGTGLNSLMSYYEAENHDLILDYTGIEAYPVSQEELESLGYSGLFSQNDAAEVFEKLHKISWGKKTEISPFFYLQKEQMFFKDIKAEDVFDLIFFDAFGPRVQPELWTEDIFLKMYRSLRRDGVLVTYSAKGSVRRAMQSVGFIVERLPGPPGKREMLRATKREN